MTYLYPESPAEPLTITIAEQIAAQKDTSPMDLEPPLYAAIDTEALEELFTRTKDGPRNGVVVFEYQGCRVRIVDGETVTVDALTDE